MNKLNTENLKLIREISARTNAKERYSIIGTELRSRRISRSKTIENISSDVCSASYLCKVERGNIIPNKKLLSELFVKLEIKQEKMNALINLEKKLEDIIYAFMNNDHDTILEAYEECKEFVNYRAMIIKLAYYLSINDTAKARTITNDLDTLIATMSTKDFTYYVIFKSILYYKEGCYDEAYSYLDGVLEITSSTACKRLIYLYKFYTSFKANNRQIFYDYKKALDSFIYCGDYGIIDNINYLYSINLIYNKMESNAKEVIEGITNTKLRNTVAVYYKVTFDSNYMVNYKDIDSVNDMMKLYIIYKLKNDELINYFNKYSHSLDIEFEPEIFKYLLLKNGLEKYEYIEELINNDKINHMSGYFKEYIFNELVRLASILGKYKLLTKAFLRIK